MKQLLMRLIIIVLTLIMAPLFSFAETYRVKISGSDTGNGSDWGANAMSNKKFAQTLLTAQPGDIFQISTGTYIPYYDVLGNVPAIVRQKTFLVRSGVQIIGGYAPDGTSSMDNSLVVLSGDIGVAGVKTDNVYNVATIAKGASNVLVSTITVSGGYADGGGIYSQGAGMFVGENAGTAGSISLSHVNVTNNSSNWHGSGIFINNNAIVEIRNSSISYNTRIGVADTWGGGISVWHNAKVNVISTEIFNNTAMHGGGVHVAQATYNSSSSIYSNNSSGTDGGAIDAYLNSLITSSNDQFLNNTSGYGGGIHNEAITTMQISNAVFKGNIATYEGGGFLNMGDCTATFNNCVFDGNTASTKGGGIDNKGKMTINQSRIINNSATGTPAWGGGINQSIGNLTVQQSEISGNTAKHGGGVHLEAGNSVISNTTISGNTALTEGGGVDSYAGSHNLIYTTITNNTAPANRGSGILVGARPGLQNSIVSGNANNDNVQGVLNNSGTNSADNNIIGTHFYSAGNSAGTDVNFSASAHFDILAFNRSANTQTHKLKWVTNSLENPAVGRAVKLDGSVDPTYLKDQTDKNRGNKPSLGAYDEDLFKAFDDVAYTEINTAITIEISGNDAIPESCAPVYTLETSMSPAPLYGQFSALSGTTVTYTPNAGASGTDTLYYKLKCGALSNIARVIVTVGGKDHPDNIKDEKICMEDMLPIAFSAKEKYRNTQSRLDGFSMPVVGDLDGDGKPEIIALGLRDNADGFDLQGFARYVIVYNGQTGAEILKFDLRGSGIGSTDAGFKLRYETRHNGPSKFALADLDGQKGGELVVTETVSGRVYALKPVYTNGVLTSFTKLWEVTTNHKSPIAIGSLLNFSTPMPYISDLNGDGIPEVIVYNKVYNGKTGNLILELETLDRFARPITQANVNTYTNSQNLNGGGRAYVGRRPGTIYGDDAIPAMAIIDIDNDGVMEIVAGSKVYKPNILPGSNTASGNSFTVIHGPGSVSYPKANGAAGNNTYYLSDGFTAVADIDADGHLDIIVQTTTSDGYDQSYTPLIYVWDPRNPGVVKAVVAFRARSHNGTMSMPFIGDINGSKDDYSRTKTLPEICYNTGILYTKELQGSPITYHPLSSAELTTNGRFNGTADLGTVGDNYICGHVVGFTFHANPDGSTPVHERLKMSWAMEHGDESSCTGITMFDFDADGVKELVYRDETSLRVISPARKTYIRKNEPVNALTGAIRFKKTGILSYTGHEAPVIVDVNGDGSADIITFANLTSKIASYGNLFVFEADGESWAHSRPVWNQGMYYPLQINDNLTVPSKPISTLTKFTSQRPGQLVADTIQPYNGNWIQQPIVRSGNYVPVILTPDLSLEAMKIVAIKSNPDSTIIGFTVENRGESSANSNTPITFYRTSIAPINKIITIRLGIDVFPGETVELRYTIPGSVTAGAIIHARIVDDGTNFLATGFLDCDSSNNTSYVAVIKAVDDRYSIINNSLVKFDIRENDTAFCKLLPEIIEAPKHGVAEITADSLLSYTAFNDFEGTDTLRYIIKCELGGITTTDTAYVYFNVAKMPDNISDADCWIDSPKKEWDIVLNKQIGEVATTMAMTVGDLNGDGFPDIIAFGNRARSTIKIFWGPKFDTHKEITVNADGNTNLGIARVKVSDATYESLIFYSTGTTLRAIRADGTNPWATSPSCRNSGMISFADFNQDGWAEVYVGNQIYDAATGKLVCEGQATGNSGNTLLVLTNISQTIAVDILGDANLELVAGNEIYKVDIDRTSGTTKNLTLISSVTPPAGCPADGVTVVADFDNDGKLEVLVRRRNGATTAQKNIHLYLWSPHTGTNIGKILANSIDTHEHFGVPFVGDIDGDGKADIVTLGSNGVYEIQKGFKARKYNENTNSFTSLWDINHMDQSGATGMTLFDFNNDGISEIVYRDENNLQIINGSGKSHKTGLDTIAAYTINSFTSYSETFLEYPIVVDLYGNQSSAILVTSDTKGPRILNNPPLHGYAGTAKIDIYTSNPSTPWAPARKVWNQYAYNAVNVNEDLTIPRVQLNPATVFPGEDGQLGTSDDVRPYNNFLQQQTILNRNGVPVLSAPNISVEIAAPAPTYTYIGDGDSLVITATIHNTGDAELRSPVHITVYKDVVDADTIKYVYPYLGNVSKGASVQVQFSIPNFTTWLGKTTATTALILKINDKGEAKDDQPVCETGNTTHTELFSDIVIARNDYITTLFTINVNVLGNDVYPASCTPVPLITKPPTNGTASVEASGVIKYTPTIGFVGIDSVIYKISCGGKESLALLHITVPEIPDNIDANATCYGAVSGTEWSIKEAKNFGTTVSTYLTAFVGDLNNDGYPDIVTGTKMNDDAIVKPSGWWTSHISKHITVFKGPDHETTISQKEFETVYPYYPVMPGVMAIARVKYAGVDTGMIVVAEGDLKLRAYDVDGNNLWTSDENWTAAPLPTGASPSIPETSIGFADFNNDGKVEIYSGNRIFNAETGRLLCKGNQNSGLSRHTKVEDKNAADVTFSIAANIYGDSRLELIAGNQVYEVAQDLSSMQVVRQVTPPASSEDPSLVIPNDGLTQIIDIDNDGSLDILVERWVSKGNHFIYVWNPEREEVLTQKLLTNSNHIGIPFIGDVDGQKDAGGVTHPEILLIGSDYGTNGLGTPDPDYNRIFAFKYNGTQLLGDFWTLKHSDISGLTGLVLFDFNQDGISEIVYRDQTHLRIINGSKISHITGNDTTDVYNLATFANKSGTGFEYPVVADVDADGSAEIIIAGGTSYNAVTGALRIYKSNGEVWAPARKVWNQYAYNVVNVNEDLTIPRYQLNPAAVFPGTDGILGTADDVRPFNAFLQQQTVLNKDGMSLWLLPNVQITSSPDPTYVYHGVGDSLVITVTVNNIGDKHIVSPFYITVYKDVIDADTIKYVYTYNNNIPENTSANIQFAINDFTTWIGKTTATTALILKINDKGEAKDDQPVCQTANTTHTELFSDIVIASNDYITTLFPIDVNVLANDVYPASCTPVPLITKPPTNGIASVDASGVIKYTPTIGFVGIDSVIYKISCGGKESSALLHITVPKMPDNIDDANCYITPNKFDWEIKQDYQSPTAVHHTYAIPLVGDVDGDGIPEIITVNTNRQYLNILWGDKSKPASSIKVAHYINSELTTGGSVSPYAMYKTKINGADKVLIAVIGGEKATTKGEHLYAYDLNGPADQSTTPVWTAPSLVTSVLLRESVSVADFDGDGIPEVYLSNRIYCGNTGKLLVSGGTTTNKGSGSNSFFTVAANVIGDAKLELIAGSEVYDVDISDKTGTLGTNKLTKVAWLKDVPKFANAASAKDGFSVIADINQDGKLDVIYVSSDKPLLEGINVKLIAWDVASGELLCQSESVSSAKGVGVPFIGNIDTIPDLEAVFMVRDKLLGYKPNFTDKKFVLKYQTAVVDESGSTGMTIFDFNNDKVGEIVYRDQDNLRIMRANPLTNKFENLKTYPGRSGTSFEYPVVADVDNDGASEIVVVSSTAYMSDVGSLRIYRSGSANSWAPARKVWNQYAYNVVNVNEDLTIPRYQLNPTTIFPGDDGILGTADDVRPYNNFLQQQTILNKNGVPIFLAPDAVIVNPAPVIVYHGDGDSIVVTLTVKNEGDAAFQNPFYLSAYANNIAAANIMAVDSVKSSIAVGDSVTTSITIRDVNSYMPFTNLVISLNDKGDGNYNQPECKYNNNNHIRPFSSLLMANRDVAHTLKNKEVSIAVLANDSLAACKTGVLTGFGIIPGSGVHNGTLTVNNSDSTFTYKPNTGFVGTDSVIYYIKCDADSSAAKVYFNVYKKPDNIIDSVDCVAPLNAFDFKIKQQWETVNAGHTVTGTLVGDLDGDGLPEIIAYSPNLSAVNVYNGQTGAFIDSIKFDGAYFGGKDGWIPHMTSILVDADRNGLAEIIGVKTDTREIYSYEADTTGGTLKLKLKWKAARPFENPYATDNLPHLNVADFNGDGVPELLIYNQIYNAAIGDYLGQTEAMATAHKGCDTGRLEKWNRSSNFQTTADFDGDGFPEIVAGGKIYKVNFNAAKTAVTCSVLKSNATVPDGFTAVADIDMDGNLDVVVVSTSRDTVSLYVWSPLTTWSTSKVLCASIVSPSYPAHSFPFIGDIDGATDGVTGKQHPEICVVTARNAGESDQSYVRAYKYDSATKEMVEKWTLGTSDASGGTGITLFDFNNDGVNELVYRDETHLRILNGVADGIEPILADPGAEFDCFSRTAFEYPVIADTDGDGSANICITCREANGSGSHNLRVYESGSQPWAPTRRVWNQVNYEPLQINEDLTVPKMSIPKNMAFNGKYPYNGALIQVPIVDENFNPVIPAPDPATAGMKLEAINATTLRVWFDIQNKGTRFTNVSLPITLYHTDTIAANVIDTKPIGVSLAPGDTVSIYWDIPSPLPYAKFIVRIQDDGVKYPADGSYLDCNYSNNRDSINILLAVNDTLSLTSTGSGITFDVLANDFLGACGRNLTAFDTIPNSGLNNGSLVINADGTFTYTFTAGSSGVDSLSYYIKCAADSSVAKVYLLVNKPLSKQYVACPGAFVDMGFKPILGVRYIWYAHEVGPPPIALNHTYPVIKDGPNDKGTWWVEPIWKGIKFPRYRIDLLPSDNCGVINPTDCAVEGTVLWKENFDSYNDGLNPFSPKYSQVPLIAGMTTYNFMSYQGTFPTTGMYAPGSYAIVKDALDPDRTDSWLGLFRDDHTYPNDKAKGRFFVANGRKAKDQLYKQEIDGLCDSVSSLYFSFWTRGYQAELKWTIYSSDTDEVLSVLSLPPMPDPNLVTADSKWLHYGFKFEVPTGVSGIYFDIYNNCDLATGNDFAIDDIEVRLCAPLVIITNPINADTMVCANTEFIFEGNYEDNPVTFGDDLVYRWEYSATGDINDPAVWSVIPGTQGTSNDGKVTDTQSKYTIASVKKSDEGYYRLVVGNASTINSYKCRAMSKVIRLGIQDFRATPDIRIQVCPNIGNINFSSYLDTIGFHSVTWSGSATMPTVSALGIVNSNDFANSATYKYFFKVESMGKCLTSEGILYASTIKNIEIKLPPDTIVVCHKYADALQLNQILGIEAGSTIEAEEAIINIDYVKRAVSPAIYYGATIFNGEAVYNNSALSGAVYDYTGPLTTGLAKKVVFKYTPAPGSCLGGKVYRFVIILTDELIL